VGSLAILDFQQGYSHEHFPEEDQLRPQKQMEETKEKRLVPSLSSPSYILSMSEKFGHDSLNTEGWIGDYPCLVTGVSMMIARSNIIA
jgi:hypothetical protein